MVTSYCVILILSSVFIGTANSYHQEYNHDGIKISPYDTEVKLRQDIFLSCHTQGVIQNCTWEANGASSAYEPTIDNWIFNSKHFGRCRIKVKVTYADIGDWTCFIFTEESGQHARNATTQISLVIKQPHGLYATLCIGLFLVMGYIVGFISQFMCERKEWDQSIIFASATPLTHQASVGFTYSRHHGSLSAHSPRENDFTKCSVSTISGKSC